MDLKRLGWREGWQYLMRRWRSFAVGLTRYFLITHSHLVDVLAAVVVLSVAFYMVIVLLYTSPTKVDVEGAAPATLKVEVLDRLVDWMREREGERDEGLVLSNDNMFP